MRLFSLSDLRTTRTAWRRLRMVMVLVAMTMATIICLSGYGHGLEQALRGVRDGLRERPASGQLHIVEIDAASVARERRWPWPRAIYAELLDRLAKAGVDSVAFDIDFSARSDESNDRAFASAIARFPGTVILPTFRQTGTSDGGAFVESLPIAPLREKALLASVNVHPDRDGMIRLYSYGTHTSGVPRPSVAAMLAGTAGRIEEQFSIDQAINPHSIPRHSVIDLLDGKVPAGSLRGKRVIIGGTAIELGDRYAVPRHGILPGVVIQGQAAETLIAGTPMIDLGPWPALILAFIAAMLAQRFAMREPRTAIVAGGAVAVCGLAMGLEWLGIGSLAIVPALVLCAITVSLSIVLDLMQTIVLGQRRDARSGLPNGLALAETVARDGQGTVVVAFFPRIAELSAMLSQADRAILQKKIADRLSLAAQEAVIHLEGADLFAWAPRRAMADEELLDQFATLANIFRGVIQIGEKNLLLRPHFGLATNAEVSAPDLIARGIRAAAYAKTTDSLWERDDAVLVSEIEDAQLLLGDVEAALAEKQFWMAYQPKLDLKRDAIHSAEALIRWQHPTRGQVSPGHFIPLLEEHGLMSELTLYIVRQVASDLTEWNARGLSLNVAVNISAALLLDEAFSQALHRTLDDLGEIIRQLTFEITETAAIAKPDEATRALDAISSRGIRISIDDYGTGQSTLTYLKQFPANEIKLDQSFVTGMLENRNDQIMVRSTIDMAHQLGFKIVAEGVEDGACLALLKSLGCDMAQGWHIGKPQSKETFVAFVEQFALAA